MLAVLSYGESASSAAADVEQLQRDGWRHVDVAQLAEVRTRGDSQRFFHVALEGDAWRDQAALRALSAVGCAYTLFVSIGNADDATLRELRALEESRPGTLQDGSLHRRYQAHFRKVLHFHTAHGGQPPPQGLASLREGDPVFLGGSELAAPRFDVDPAVVAHCHQIADAFQGARGSLKWLEAMKHSLRARKLGWDQFGPLRKSYLNWSRARFCVRGRYETQREFRQRIAEYLATGRQRLRAFTGQDPIAFAHPWAESSPVADRCLGELGYGFTLPGRDLARTLVTPQTVRPLRPDALASQRPRVTRHAFRRFLYA